MLETVQSLKKKKIRKVKVENLVYTCFHEAWLLIKYSGIKEQLVSMNAAL